jgi:hypothetical protein
MRRHRQQGEAATMSSDRGTMQRGPAPGIDQPGAWSEPTAPAGRRVPSAPRERKPVLAALAVLLILGGAAGAGLLVLQSGKRVAAVEISQQIGAGQKIPLSAMQEIQIASGTGLSYVPWNEASQVTQFYAASAIPPGTLLTSAMVVRANAVTTGKYVLGLALKDGQWPVQLAIGDHVAIYAVSAAAAGTGCRAAAGFPLAPDAIVLAMGGSGASSSGPSSSSAATDVTVAVSPADAGAVACNASGQNVALALLPAGGSGPAGGASSAGPGGAGSPQNTTSSSPSPSIGTG